MPVASQQMIAAIITDLGGVLIDVGKEKMCAELAKHSQLSAEEIGKHLSGLVVHSSGPERDLSKGLITPSQFFAAVSKQLQLRGLSFQEFERIYSDRFTPKKDVLSIIRKVSKRFAVAMLSNTNEMHYKYWAKTLGEDMKIFKELVLSFRIHAAKPDSKIFLEAGRRLGVEPQQCVFIDDIEEYVKAARKVGMLGIRFTSAEQLWTDLEKIGIAV
ncbi:MAG: HAD family phosphatase [Nanoarchaeota archaeon]